MATKKTPGKSKSNVRGSASPVSPADKEPKSEVSLTRDEYEQYFDRTQDAIYTLALIVAGGRFPSESRPDDVSAWACMASYDAFSKVDHEIMVRWQQDGETAPVVISAKQIKELKKAYAPAFSFCNFVRHQDVSHGDGGVTSQSAGTILELVQVLAEQGFALLNSRLSVAEGGAR